LDSPEKQLFPRPSSSDPTPSVLVSAGSSFTVSISVSVAKCDMGPGKIPLSSGLTFSAAEAPLDLSTVASIIWKIKQFSKNIFSFVIKHKYVWMTQLGDAANSQ